MHVAVIITVYNRIENTLNCLEKFYQATSYTPAIIYDIYLVDDGSVDSTSSILEEKYTGINIVSGNGELFWCRGMALGWHVASNTRDYDAYIWLNNDTYLFHDSLTILLQYSPESEFIISGACKSQYSEKTTYGGRLRGQLNNLDPNNELQEIEWMNGNFVVVSRFAFEKIGFLDDKFHHGIGDYDYGLRAIKNDIKVYLSRTYVGFCEDRDSYMECYDPKKPLIKRFKHFYSPLGDNPFQRWIFLSRHYSVLKAMKSFLVTHLVVLNPGLAESLSKYFKKVI